MDLRKCIFTHNRCYYEEGSIDVRGIMVHSTGANNNSLKRYVQPDDGLLGKNQYSNDWNRYQEPGYGVCVHAFIGLDKNGNVCTYQTLPWNHRAWHSGGGANDTHISFEICEDDLTDKAYFDAVYKESAELCAYLCREFNLDPLKDGVLICHSEGYQRGIASGHADVMHWFPRFGKSMDTFRKYVDDIMNKKQEADEVFTYENFCDYMTKYMSEAGTGNNCSDWAKEATAKAKEVGVFNGDGDGNFGWQKPITREAVAQALYNAGVLDNTKNREVL